MRGFLTALLVRECRWCRQATRLAPPALVTAGTLRALSDDTMTTTAEQKEKDRTPSSGDSEGKKQDVFDVTFQLDDLKKGGVAFFQNIFSEEEEEEEEKDGKTPQNSAFTNTTKFVNNIRDTFQETITKNFTANAPTMADVEDVSSSLLTLLKGGSGVASSMEDIVGKARKLGEQGDVSDKASLEDLLKISQEAVRELDKTMSSMLGEKSLPDIGPTNLFYFLEDEDARKNFSWKRRKHRYYAGVDVDQMETLNEKMQLAYLCYADSLEEIKQELSEQYELLFCDVESSPDRPSHLIAVKKNQSVLTDHLDVILVVRGTKTVTDVITDLLCHNVDYKGGKAHAGMLESGRYLAKKHEKLLKRLCDSSGKSKVKLELIGHSLGGGAASICALELNEKDFIEVQVYGFGSPAIVSRDIAEEAQDYITTIICDNDCIPRMSTVTMLNLLLDVGEYDWIPGARRDLDEAVEQISKNLPSVFPSSAKSTLKSLIESNLIDTESIPSPTEKRFEPVLFPPGRCFHFYRDGYGVSGSIVPPTFFDEIDLNRRMVADHLFRTGYGTIFLDLMRQHYDNPHFAFEADVEKLYK